MRTATRTASAAMRKRPLRLAWAVPAPIARCPVRCLPGGIFGALPGRLERSAMLAARALPAAGLARPAAAGLNSRPLQRSSPAWIAPRLARGAQVGVAAGVFKGCRPSRAVPFVAIAPQDRHNFDVDAAPACLHRRR